MTASSCSRPWRVVVLEASLSPRHRASDFSPAGFVVCRASFSGLLAEAAGAGPAQLLQLLPQLHLHPGILHGALPPHLVRHARTHMPTTRCLTAHCFITQESVNQRIQQNLVQLPGGRAAPVVLLMGWSPTARPISPLHLLKPPLRDAGPEGCRHNQPGSQNTLQTNNDRVCRLPACSPVLPAGRTRARS